MDGANRTTVGRTDRSIWVSWAGSAGVANNYAGAGNLDVVDRSDGAG
jgi:hypothetical protein